MRNTAFNLALSALPAILILTNSAVADTPAQYSAGEISYNRLTIPTPSDTLGLPLSTDLDGDGDSDLILSGATFPSAGGSSRGGQRGMILFNNGDNTFSEAEGDYPLSEHAREYLLADFNGDGILDIYIADHGYDVDPFPGFPDQLLLGTGTGFTDVSNRLPDIAAFTHNAAAGDIDGDGDIDILSLNADTIEEELSYFLLNDGDANFTLDRSRLPASLRVAGQLKNSYGAELGDLDNDGFPDLIIGRNQYTDLTPTRIHWNDGQGFFSDSNVSYLDEIDVFANLEVLTVVDIQSVDINTDGLNDLLVHSYNANGFSGTSIQLFINNGSRQFTNETVKRLGNIAINADPAYGVPTLLHVMDVNGDGVMDLLPHESTGIADDKLFMFEGTGNGCFAPITLGAVTDDPEARYRLTKVPLVSSQEFGYAEFFSITENGQSTITSNYVPITVSTQPAVANYYHNCSGKLKFSLQVDNGAMYTSDFSLTATAPNIIVQIDLASVTELTVPRDKIAAFSSATGTLSVPELEVDGVVALRNLSFQLIDAEQLLFQLMSYE